MPRRATPRAPRLDTRAPGPFWFASDEAVLVYTFKVSPFADALQVRVGQDGAQTITLALVPPPVEASR